MMEQVAPALPHWPGIRELISNCDMDELATVLAHWRIALAQNGDQPPHGSC
jgi:hypothetical protein